LLTVSPTGITIDANCPSSPTVMQNEAISITLPEESVNKVDINLLLDDTGSRAICRHGKLDIQRPVSGLQAALPTVDFGSVTA
jgi:hypothetical protein